MLSVNRNRPTVVPPPSPVATPPTPPATPSTDPSPTGPTHLGYSKDDVFEAASNGADDLAKASSYEEPLDISGLDLNNPEVIQDLAETFGVEHVNLQKRSNDSEFDGALVGVDKAIKMGDLQGMRDLSALKPGDLSPFEPKNWRDKKNELIIQVNGINTDLSQQKQALQATADATGASVIGIHNATDGFAGDLMQSVGDKLNTGKNLAVDSMRDIVLGELRAGKKVHLMAHSQGGLITSRALGEVAEQLKKENKSDLMGQIKVETFGAASGRYPDGPQYVHYINESDPVSNLFGVEGSTSFMNNPGKDVLGHEARIIKFKEKSLIAAHNYNDVYMKHREDFNAAYGGVSNRFVVQDPSLYKLD
ncbi:hypothetical protein [Cystobacter fuscus]|uniref:hypothetical protein n=1 Tax=Cystobacter fuscus TaxID=43 RepID=UPI002B29DB6B|nr:hypothetical protein F0U63_44290 [Cystobacter fuscus]